MTSEATAEDYKKGLEYELSLDSSDLKSHAWYHGNIPRSRAEELMRADEDFLVRDCSSRPGDFVLSCRWSGACLHFVINKVVLQPYTVYERVQYTFEDDFFDTVPDLVTYYVGNRRPISAASSAIISRPVNRSMPLSYYATRYSKSPCSTLTRESRYARSPLSKCSLSGITADRPASRQSVHSQPDEPPPKPYREPNLVVLDQLQPARVEPIYINVADEAENGEDSAEDSAFFSDSSRKTSDERKNEDSTSDFEQHNFLQSYTMPAFNLSSSFNPQNFFTFLLVKENKPLDSLAVNKIRSVLLQTGARILANHLTKIDLDFIKHLDSGFSYGVSSGIELLTLPQGEVYREDLIDRSECFKYFVAVSVLICSDEEERTSVLHKWIQIAIETKTALGNLTGFRNVMAGLSLPQISRLRNTWLKLRQNFTEDAFLYESKLRPTLKAMLDSNEPHAPNTTFPYVLRLVEIIRQHYSFMKELSADMSPDEVVRKFKTFKFDSVAEPSGTDFGLHLFYSHLEAGRQLVNKCSLFKRNSEIVLDCATFEELLLDMFKTEFHQRFLWGYRGCVVEPAERYSKFEQVLSLLSTKCEPA